MKLFLLYFLLSFTAFPGLRAATPDDQDAASLEFLRKNAPAIHTIILSLKDGEPEDYRSAMSDAAEAAADHAALSAAGDSKAAEARLRMYVIDFDAIGVADEIAACKDEAKLPELKTKLRALIDASFAQWAIVEDARIRRMEKELAALKTAYADAVNRRAEVVESDAATLIEECREFQKNKTKVKK